MLTCSALRSCPGPQPTGTTYTSLISAYGKAGQVEEAVRIYQVILGARGRAPPCARATRGGHPIC